MSGQPSPSDRLERRARRGQHRFKVLLGFLFLMLLAAPVLKHANRWLSPAVGGAIVSAIVIAIVLSAVYSVGGRRWTTRLAWVLVVPLVLMELASLFVESNAQFVAEHVLAMAVLGLVAVLIIGWLFRTSEVTYDMIAAAVCVYLLLALAWSYAYSVLAYVDPDSFYSAGRETDIRFGGMGTVDTIYYSLVTMTTLGFGDIVPRSAGAQMLSATQAVFGQVYLAVLVARLVGLQIASAAAANSRNRDDP